MTDEELWTPPKTDHPWPWKVVDANGNEVPGVMGKVCKVVLKSARHFTLKAAVDELNDLMVERGLDLEVET